MDDQLEEEAVVIAGTSTFLWAMSTIFKYHERKDVEIPQILHQPRVNRGIDKENYINSVCYYVEIGIVLTKFE